MHQPVTPRASLSCFIDTITWSRFGSTLISLIPIKHHPLPIKTKLIEDIKAKLKWFINFIYLPPQEPGVRGGLLTYMPAKHIEERPYA